MTILTMVKYEWFEEWKDTTVRKRGDEYHQYKMRFAKRLFDWACTVFPKIKDKVGGPRMSSRVQVPLQAPKQLEHQHSKFVIGHKHRYDVGVAGSNIINFLNFLELLTSYLFWCR